jgi:NAD-dependent dihydropyrimidine dehydrogenase PreA subunit
MEVTSGLYHRRTLYRDQRYCLRGSARWIVSIRRKGTYDDARPTFDEVPQLYIDPTEGIDFGACVPVCPVTAIFPLDDLPEKWHAYIETNKNYVEGGKFQRDKYQRPSG